MFSIWERLHGKHFVKGPFKKQKQNLKGDGMALSQIHSRQAIHIFTTHLPVRVLSSVKNSPVNVGPKSVLVLTGGISVVLLKATMFCVITNQWSTGDIFMVFESFYLYLCCLVDIS